MSKVKKAKPAPVQEAVALPSELKIPDDSFPEPAVTTQSDAVSSISRTPGQSGTLKERMARLSAGAGGTGSILAHATSYVLCGRQF